MTITMDGYRINRTMTLEDMETDLSTSLGSVAEDAWIRSPLDSITRINELENATNEEYISESIPGDSVGPLADMGVNFAPTADYSIQKRQRKSLSKAQADAIIKEAGVKLEIGENGIPDEALSILITRKREEIKRNALISSAPPGFWSGAAKIGTGLAVSIADPLNVASAFIPVIGQSRYAALLAGASGAAGRAGVRAGVGAAQGLVGAAVVEPLVLGAAYQEQADYGLYNSYMNLAFGTVLGGGLHSGLGAIGDVIGRSSAAAKESVLQGATAQMIDDVPVNVGYIAETIDDFMSPFPSTEVSIRERSLVEEIDIARASGEKAREIRYSNSHGHVTTVVIGSEMRIRAAEISESSRGQGKGVEIYSEIIRDAKRMGLKVIESDNSVSESAQRVWKSLERRGLDLKRNPDAYEVNVKGYKALVVEDDFQPVFTARIDDLEVDGIKADPPTRNPQSIYADAESSIDATATIDRQLDETPETVQGLTDNILLAAEENGLDTSLVRAEISQIDEIAERENAGLREALFCMMGK